MNSTLPTLPHLLTYDITCNVGPERKLPVLQRASFLTSKIGHKSYGSKLSFTFTADKVSRANARHVNLTSNIMYEMKSRTDFLCTPLFVIRYRGINK